MNATKVDKALFCALEGHLSFLAIFKCANLKFRSAFSIVLDRFEKLKPFMGVTKYLAPIVDQFK